MRHVRDKLRKATTATSTETCQLENRQSLGTVRTSVSVTAEQVQCTQTVEDDTVPVDQLSTEIRRNQSEVYLSNQPAVSPTQCKQRE